jgi:hypothetical protein
LALSDGQRSDACAYGQPGATLWRAVDFVAFATLTACTELAPGTDSLTQGIGSNLADASTEDPRWSCLDEPAANSADRQVPTVDFAVGVLDTVTNTLPEGVTARACAKRDVSCSTPLVAPVSPSGDGLMHLDVAQGFDGYVEITSPATVATMYFLNRALMRDTTRSLPIVSRLALGALAMGANISLDPAQGHVLMSVFDCMGDAAGDIQLVNDTGGLPFVFVDGLPQIGTDVTSPTGIGGFVNVPAGFAVLQGRLAADQRAIGVTNVVVRGEWFSYSDIQPL